MPITQQTIDGLPAETRELVEEHIYAAQKALRSELTSAAESVGITMFKSLLSEEKGCAVADLAFSLDPCNCSKLAEYHPDLRASMQALEAAGVKLAELNTPD